MLRPGRSSTSRSRGSSTPNERAISPRPSISARRTFRPDESAAIASAAATEDFPAPPLPDTRRMSRSNRSDQRIGGHYRYGVRVGGALVTGAARRIAHVLPLVRTLRWLTLATMVVAIGGGSAKADPIRASTAASVDVIQVQGVIDPPVASYVRGSIERSESLGATVILQIDSKGGFGDEAARLGRMIRSSSVPV